ncbi:hypothetical protein ACJX0J_031241, partial [Zea mays]
GLCSIKVSRPPLLEDVAIKSEKKWKREVEQSTMAVCKKRHLEMKRTRLTRAGLGWSITSSTDMEDMTSTEVKASSNAQPERVWDAVEVVLPVARGEHPRERLGTASSSSSPVAITERGIAGEAGALPSMVTIMVECHEEART